MGGCISIRKETSKKHNKRFLSLRPRKESSKFNTHFPGLPVADVYNVPTLQSSRKVESDDASNYICLDGDTLVEINKKASTRRSREDTWFDAGTWFESDSEDEYLSVYGDFASSTGNTLSLSQSLPETPRPSISALKERLEKLDASCTLPESVENAELSETVVAVRSSNMHDKKPSRRTKLHLLFAETADEAPNRDHALSGFSDISNARQSSSDTFHRNSVVSVTPVTDDSHSLEDRKGDQHTYELSCLPCLTSGAIPNEKKKYPSAHSSSQQRKTSRKFSLKRAVAALI